MYDEANQETAARACCDDPASYTYHQNFTVEPETGYCDGDYWECVCGERIDERDFGRLIAWTEAQAESAATSVARIPISAETAGVVETERKIA